MLLGSSGDYRSSNWSVDICLYICVKKEGRNTHFFLSTLCRCDNVFSQTWILLLYFGYLHKVNFNDEYNNNSKALFESKKTGGVCAPCAPLIFCPWLADHNPLMGIHKIRKYRCSKGEVKTSSMGAMALVDFE